MDALLTTEEVASVLRLDDLKHGRKAVHRLIRQGRLKGFKIGKRYLVRSSDLQAFIEHAAQN